MIYSYHKAKIINWEIKGISPTKHTKENKSEDTEMEDQCSKKMEHDDLDLITKYHAATTTPININIVYYSLPHSLLSPIIFSVYVIQVSQSYVTL